MGKVSTKRTKSAVSSSGGGEKKRVGKCRQKMGEELAKIDTLWVLGEMAVAIGVKLEEVPERRVAYLSALLEVGTHKRALAKIRMEQKEYFSCYQDPRCKKMISVVRGFLEDVKLEECSDLLFELAKKNPRVLMYLLERRDKRYTPPQVLAQIGQRENAGPAIQINIGVPTGRTVSVYAITAKLVVVCPVAINTSVLQCVG